MKNRQTLLLAIVVALVGLFILDRLIYAPLKDGWSERAETIKELRISISSGRSMIDRENSIRRTWNDIRRNTLPANTSAAEQQVLEAFDRWTRESRVTVNSINPQWRPGETDDYSMLECRIDAAGDMEAITKLLYAVENTEMALKIDSVTLQSRDGTGQQLTLDLAVSGLRLGSLEQN